MVASYADSRTLGLARVAPEKPECLTACQSHYSDAFKGRHMNTEEQWKPVVGFEAHYIVSNLGRVKRISKTNRADKEYILGWKTSHGYWAVTFTVGGKGYTRYLHRVLAMAFHPNPNNCREVNHIDGDKSNSALSNIEWVTPRQNQHHAKLHGLNPPNTARLKLGQVLHIRAILAVTSRGVKSIAREFGVTHGTISQIRDGRSYRWLGDATPITRPSQEESHGE